MPFTLQCWDQQISWRQSCNHLGPGKQSYLKLGLCMRRIVPGAHMGPVQESNHDRHPGSSAPVDPEAVVVSIFCARASVLPLLELRCSASLRHANLHVSSQCLKTTVKQSASMQFVAQSVGQKVCCHAREAFFTFRFNLSARLKILSFIPVFFQTSLKWPTLPL